MLRQPDQVAVEDAYAAALEEIGRLNERLILAQAFIRRLRREAQDAPTSAGDTGHASGGNSPHHFSD